ncbi:hypothetical protein CEXT_224431 [Caerostris extrusa]|uniref:Uncharacterized protein n=1 Tax=Caerostris extrusa TaxID=172846 RepID=A0AAV4NJB7_CAEEX|nr:hypothetical protein CEXT_224431 [Caerostris extrusa]
MQPYPFMHQSFSKYCILCFLKQKEYESNFNLIKFLKKVLLCSSRFCLRNKRTPDDGEQSGGKLLELLSLLVKTARSEFSKYLLQAHNDLRWTLN